LRAGSTFGRVFVYLHGFNSSPASFKARLVRARLAALGRADEFVAPHLPHRPAAAVATIEQALAGLAPEEVTLIGSSLRGHYATWIAERYGTRAALINPAIAPHVLLAQALGAQRNLYTGEAYELVQAHLDELRSIDVARITRPERYLLIVATGDEVLDSRVAIEKYRGAVQIVHSGGDHGFAEFERYVDAVIDFGGVAA
jgi:predicted esterase YcpF (UPF0227 family)